MQNDQYTVHELQAKVSELRKGLFEAIDEFILRNPQIPAQIIMAGLGELFVQFSVGQVGPQITDQLLDQLKAAVRQYSLSQH